MSRETADHVLYIDRTRACYEAEGYAKPYEWALTKVQPFLDPESTRKWLERKEAYRALKAAGKI